MNNNENNTRCENYREYFTKDHLMGPNSLRLLDEILRKYPLQPGSRVMDLGCGEAITSLFLAKEAKVQVFATDLWISATQNARSIEKWGISDSVIPIHADANELPFAEEYFDAIVSIDAYHYFANKKGFFENKILPYLKAGGALLAVVPGFKEKPMGRDFDTMMEWFGNDKDAYEEFQTREWWVDLIGKGDNFEVMLDFEPECFDEAWNDWFESGHEYGIKDKAFFEKGMCKYLTFIGLVVRRTK